MTPGLLKLPRWLYAAAGVTLFVASCAESPNAPTAQKRHSYFEVVAVMDAPGRGLADLTYTHNNIWLADEDRAGTLYRLNPANGSVIASVGTSYGPPAAICSDGAYLYVAAGDAGDVWRHNIGSRMEELASFPTGLTDIRGMYYDAGTFYVWDQATFAVYEFDDAWQRGASWRVEPGEEWIRGITKADGRVWSADWRNGWLNRHRKTNYDIDRKFCTPGWHPAGLGWDGAYLYLGDSGSRLIYKLDISTAP